MLLKLHNRTPARLALAGLLAVTSISAFAQTAAPAQGNPPSAMGSNRPPEMPPMPGRGLSAEGRLKPTVVNPRQTSQDGQQMSSSQGMPGAPPGMAHMPSGMTAYPMAAPGVAPPPAIPAPAPNPFAPAGPVAPMAAPTQMLPPGSATPGVKTTPIHTKPPAINLACTTSEIKTQGVFLGKIQNRYVYKYKNQYCFDIEP